MTFERESVGVCFPGGKKLLNYQGFCQGWEETNSKEIENAFFFFFWSINPAGKT